MSGETLKPKSNFPTETDGAVTGESICIGGLFYGKQTVLKLRNFNILVLIKGRMRTLNQTMSTSG